MSDDFGISEKNIKFSGHKSYICCYEIIIAKETNDSKQDFKENFYNVCFITRKFRDCGTDLSGDLVFKKYFEYFL